ncbi:MAG: RidA family protein [Clostridiales bacterium]|jgi:enamine deaminase RidA (YjgF/YER057c/UK114 family)|nr:RidA family protein [Clostridiales bacterium]
MSMEINRLKAIELDLPPIRLEKQGVVTHKTVDGLLWISGVEPVDENGKLAYVGRVGSEFTVEDAYRAARLCGLTVLKYIKDAAGSLDGVDFVVKSIVCVSAVKGFGDIYKVADGFSDVLAEALGERGLHARNAIGASTLNHNVPVVCDAIVKLRD